MRNAARLLGPGSAFLLGVDLKKSERILVPAYNDARGVTAAFNLNLLVRANRELGGDFDLSRFAHDAVWNEAAGRIEMYLVSLAEQTVRVAGRDFDFAEGERIHTENSHKYTVDEFRRSPARSGWTPGQRLDRPRPALQPAPAAALTSARRINPTRPCAARRARQEGIPGRRDPICRARQPPRRC